MQCHGEHTLVEIFQKRNFTCDCGTTRFPSTSPCSLRTNHETNTRGGVHSEEPDVNNKYNQNFRNRFCSCECDYDPFQQKGTMFQCLGLGTAETGGCGEDWYHPGCLVGMGPKWFEKMKIANKSSSGTEVDEKNALPTISEDNEGGQEATANSLRNNNEVAVEDDDDDPPMPPGFPDEDAFEGFLCFKCVESNPWTKRYAGFSSFHPPVLLCSDPDKAVEAGETKKRRADDDGDDHGGAKRIKSETDEPAPASGENVASTSADDSKASEAAAECKLPNLPAAPDGRFSLFFKEDFRDKLCRCLSCYEHLNEHAQLLEEEEVYEPPISEEGSHGGSTNGSGSLLERGESALRNVDRVRAIEGVMAYNHLRERLKPFFQQFAESGQAIGAEDIKAYFAKLRGDEQGIKDAGDAAAASSSKDDDGDHHRHEQSGY